MNEKLFKQAIALFVGAIAFGKSVNPMESDKDLAEASFDLGDRFVDVAMKRHPDIFKAIREAH